MADSRRGKRLTEEHRQRQLQIRAAFLQQFFDLWPLMDPHRVDDTGAAWIQAVMPLIAEYREVSAQAAEGYYRDFRMAEAPTIALATPVPEVERVGRGTGQRRPRQGRPTGDPPPDTPEPQRRSQSRRGRVVRPRIIWDEEDRKTRTSLAVTGPANVKSKTRRGKSPEQAAREAIIEAGGSAARHVLTGGRETHLELVHADPEAIGWMRVTDGDPCAFCAMLSSRGPRYKSQASASVVVDPKARRALGEQYHDNCGCTAEAVYSRSQAWPGRGREFQELWNRWAKGKKDPLNAFRREYERGLREAAREREAETG
jgi:hypothetical protein